MDRLINLATVRFVAIYRIYLFVTDLGKSQTPFRYLICWIDCAGQCNNLCKNASLNENVHSNYVVIVSSIYISSPCRTFLLAGNDNCQFKVYLLMLNFLLTHCKISTVLLYRIYYLPSIMYIRLCRPKVTANI